MAIRFTNPRDNLVLTPLERTPDDQPTPGDVRFHIAVKAHSFTGVDEQWVSRAALKAFVAQLRELEQTKRGFAELKGKEPGFSLFIEPVDSYGHMIVAGDLICYVYTSNAGPFRQTMRFVVEFEPAQVPDVLQGFEELL